MSDNMKHNASEHADGQSRLNVGLAAYPEDCVCEPLSWFGEIKQICDDYLSDEGHSQCKRCEHDKGCHKAANAELTGSL